MCGDQLLLSLLAATPSLPDHAGPAVAAVWHAQRLPQECLAAFLVRGRCLRPTAERTLDWFARGLVTLPHAEPLFHADGFRRFREQFAAAADTDHLWQTLPVAAPRPAPAADLAGDSSIDLGATNAEIIVPAGRRAEPPRIGQVLGKCLLVEQIGKGGAGVVFRALHQGLNIPVAVKVLHGEFADAPAAYAQLKAEARLLAQLNHPNVVRVFDFEDAAAYPYIVMECVEGINLADLIRQGGVLPARAARIAVQAAEALAAAWGVGIVHRDVKPANILLTRDGGVKLADLGVALVHASGTPFPAAGSAASPSRQMVGTAAYMAPEQFAAAAEVDFRADIYSLGVTLYHAVTGRLPFAAKSLMSMIVEHMKKKPVPPSALVPGLPDRLSAVILRMMAKNPADRFANYDDLLAALRLAAEPGQPAAKASGLSSMFRSLVGGRAS